MSSPFTSSYYCLVFRQPFAQVLTLILKCEFMFLSGIIYLVKAMQSSIQSLETRLELSNVPHNSSNDLIVLQNNERLFPLPLLSFPNGLKVSFETIHQTIRSNKRYKCYLNDRRLGFHPFHSQ